MRRGILEKYKEWINLPEHAVPLTLAEGDTPLISVPKISQALGGGREVFVKFEGLNPTGSFKDRGMVAAISEAAGRGAAKVICASTGNTAASAAAYAARAGIRSYVLIPEGKVARGKLAAAVMYGARVIQVNGSFDDALALVQDIAPKLGIAIVNSINPYRLEGQKTAAFELCEELGKAPDLLAIPVGNAGNITAYHMGFMEHDARQHTGVPALLGVQAAGAAPLVIGQTVAKPETIATAIRIGNPVRGAQALDAARRSGGKIIAATDADILQAQALLATEGIWVEPASAAGLAGLLVEAKAGLPEAYKRIVIVCTGHGLKDPDIVNMPPPVRVNPGGMELEAALAD